MKTLLTAGLISMISLNVLAADQFTCSVGIQDFFGDDQTSEKYIRMDNLVVSADATLYKFGEGGDSKGRGVAIVMEPVKDTLRVEAAVYKNINKVTKPSDLSTTEFGDENREMKAFTAVDRNAESISVGLHVAQDAVYILYCTKE